MPPLSLLRYSSEPFPRASSLALALWLGLLVSCRAALVLPADAVLTCTGDDECPSDFVCLEDVGRCASRSSPCVGEDGRAVADGTACGDQQCVRGICSRGLCGDGVTQDDEECDPGADPLCHADCLLPVCGDGIVDLDESCDSDSVEECNVCVFACEARSEGDDLIPSADCNGDIADGCECIPEELAFPPGLSLSIYGGAFVGDTLLLTAADGAASVLVRFDLKTGTAEEIGRAGFLVSLAPAGDRALVNFSEGAGSTSTYAFVNEAGDIDVVAVDPDATIGMAADDTRFWVASGATARSEGSIGEFDLATGELLRGLDAPFIAFTLQLCGEGLVLNDFEDVAYLPLDESGATPLFEQADETFLASAGCNLRGEPLWQEPNRIMRLGPGGPVVVAAANLPPATSLGGQLGVVRSGAIVAAINLNPQVALIDGRHAPRGFALGLPRVADDNRVAYLLSTGTVAVHTFAGDLR